MPENQTGLPSANWYPDPAGAPAERWWDGTQWSEHLRETPAAPPPAPAVVIPQYAFANQEAAPAPVVPQYAFATQEAAPAAAPVIPQYTFASQEAVQTPVTPQYSYEQQPAAPVHNAYAPQQASPGQVIPQYAMAVQEAAVEQAPVIPSTAWNAGGGLYTPMGGNNLAASSYGMDFRRPYEGPLENPEANKALMWALISLVFNPAFIMWLLADRHAKKALEAAKDFEFQGRPPVGRTKARWARAIPPIVVVMYLGLIGLTVLFSSQLGLIYNGTALEKATAAQVVKGTGITPTAVHCPPTGSYELGTVIDCYISMPSGQTIQLRYTMQGIGKEAKAEVVVPGAGTEST